MNNYPLLDSSEYVLFNAMICPNCHSVLHLKVSIISPTNIKNECTRCGAKWDDVVNPDNLKVVKYTNLQLQGAPSA